MKQFIVGFFEKHAAIIFISLILGVAFLPLALGCNFLPFDRYTSHSCSITEGSDGRLGKPSAFLDLFPKYPWLHEREPASLSQFIPQDKFASDELKRGHLPLWDPYPGGGMPTLDAGQFRPFNVFRWIFFVWPTSWSYSLSLFLLVITGAIGFALFLRTLGLSAVAACVGTSAYVLNQWVLWSIALPDAGAYLVIPWVLLAFSQLKTSSQKSIAWAALSLVAMGNVGHITVCLILALAAAALALLGGMGFAEETVTIQEKARVITLAALISLLAMTLLWLPMIGFVAQSFSYKSLGVPVLFAYDWRAFVAPAADLFLLPALVFFLVASAWSWRKARPWWVMTVLPVVCFLPLPGLGENIPIFFFRQLGVMPAYLKPLLWVGLSVLVAKGVDVAKELTSRKRFVALGFGVLSMAGVIAVKLQAPELSRLSPSSIPLWSLLMLSLVSAWLLSCRQWKMHISWLLAGLVALPLAYPLAGNVLPWNHKRLGGNQLLQTLAEKYPHDRVASVFTRESGWALPSNQGSFFRIRAIEINSPFFLNRYFNLFSDTRHFPTWIYFDKLNPLAFRQAGASIVLLANGDVPEGYKVLLKGPAFSACAIPNAAGRAYFARLVAINDPMKEMSKQILALGNGADDVALVESMGFALPPLVPQVPKGEGNIEYVVDGSQEVVFRTSSKTPGLLVLRDSWYKSWKAAVDGNSVPVYRVNGCFRGVLVPPGEHRVRFFYHATSVYLGTGISGIGLLVILLLIGAGNWSGQCRQSSPQRSQ